MVTILRERKSTSLSRDKKGELQLKLEEKPKVSDEELTQFFLEKNGSFTVKDAIYLVHGSNIDKRFKRIEELGFRFNSRTVLCIMHLDYSDKKVESHMNFIDAVFDSLKSSNLHFSKQVPLSVALSKIYDLEKNKKIGNGESKFHEYWIQKYLKVFGVPDNYEPKGLGSDGNYTLTLYQKLVLEEHLNKNTDLSVVEANSDKKSLGNSFKI